MADTCCWIEFDGDLELRARAEEGRYGEQRKRATWALPLMSASIANQGYWPGVVVKWCKLRGIPYETEGFSPSFDALVRVKVSPAQIEDFIRFASDGPEDHEVASILDFVTRDMNPSKIYGLVADVFS